MLLSQIEALDNVIMWSKKVGGRGRVLQCVRFWTKETNAEGLGREGVGVRTICQNLTKGDYYLFVYLKNENYPVWSRMGMLEGEGGSTCCYPDCGFRQYCNVVKEGLG